MGKKKKPADDTPSLFDASDPSPPAPSLPSDLDPSWLAALAPETQKPYWAVPYPREEVHRLRTGRLASNDRLVTLGMAMLMTAPLGLPDLLQAQWNWRAALSMLALGALGTAVAQVLMVRAAGLFGASTASGTTFLIPVVALGLGVITTNDRQAAQPSHGRQHASQHASQARPLCACPHALHQ